MKDERWRNGKCSRRKCRRKRRGRRREEEEEKKRGVGEEIGEKKRIRQS